MDIKRVGFIDYYLDEWHANNYPELLRAHSGGKYVVTGAYAAIDSPFGGLDSRAWARHNNIKLCGDIASLVDESDVLIVLSPNDPDRHPELCDLPLRSGKNVYVDKTFASSGSEALALFRKADEHHTPCFSSSALRYASELRSIDAASVARMYTEGGGTYERYSIHQIEQIVSVMRTPAKRVMFTGDELHPSMIIEFEDGRFAHTLHRNSPAHGFRTTAVDRSNAAAIFDINSDFWGEFIRVLIEFFDTGTVPVAHEQTVEVIKIRETGLIAMKTPFEWVNIAPNK